MFRFVNLIKEYWRRRNSAPSSAVLMVVFLAVLILIWPTLVYADVWDTVYQGIAGMLLWLAKLVGRAALQLIGLLVEVAQFNNFIDAPAVKKGWVIVRDVCNMFFIVILLLLAFGTVFRIEQYQYKKILGKLLVMAVLVNFSRSITGFFIDIAQVVMLTFVNGFKEAAAGNFVQGFHLDKMYEFTEVGNTGEFSTSSGEYLVSAVLAFVSLAITLVVVGVYLVVFLLRIIALWFLTIISPIAYVLSAFPGEAKKYASQWWDYFGRYVTTGPILAFFLWLSLYIMQISPTAASQGFKVTQSQDKIPVISATRIGESEIMLSFIINIILLMGGLWMTQQLGVAGGKLAGAAMNKIQSTGAAIGKGAFRAATYLPRQYGKRIGYGTADKALGLASYIPLVGTSAIIARAKLRAKREYEEEKQGRHLHFMSDRERERIIRSKMRVPSILQTERGRSIFKKTSQYQMKSGKTPMSSQALALIRKGAAPNHPDVLAANRKFNTRFIQRVRAEAGHRIDRDNNDIYSNNEEGQVIEAYIKKNPHLIDRNYIRRVTTGPGKGTPLGSQREYTIERLTNDEIADLSFGAVSDHDFINELFENLRNRTATAINRRNSLRRKLMGPGISMTEDQLPPQLRGDQPSEEFYRQQWRGIHYLQRKSVRFGDRINDYLDTYINSLPPAEQRIIGPAAYSGRFGGADIDKNKFDRTQQLINKYSKDKNISIAEATNDFENSDEFRSEPDKYYPSDIYIQAQQALIDSAETKQSKVDEDYVSGVRGTIRKAQQSQAQGLPLGEARVAVDFKKYDLHGRGLALRGNDKDNFLTKLIEDLRQTGQYTQDELVEFQQAVQKAEQLTLINRGRTIGDARHLIAHERAHAVGDAHPELVQELWETVPEENKESIRQKIRQFQNNPNISEEDIAHEYWAEAVANDTRWKDKSSTDISLNESGRQVIKKLAQTSEDLVMSDKYTASPHNLTRPDVNITPEQLVRAMSIAEPGTVKISDSTLISALGDLSNELKSVGKGLNLLNLFADLPHHLSKALSGFLSKFNLNMNDLVSRLKYNYQLNRQANKDITNILNKYKPQVITIPKAET